MNFTLHRDFSEIPASAWNALVETGIANTPFARHEYLSQWWKSRGGGEWTDPELALVSATHDGRLVGLAPLFMASHENRTALLLVGSIEISDYLDLIVRAEDLAPFLTGLLDFVTQSPAWQKLPLDWYNIPESSPTLAALRAESEKRGWQYRRDIYRPTPRIALGGDFDAFLAGLDKKQRHEVRRKMRRAGENRGPVRFYVVEDGATLDTEIEAFFELMAQDASKAGFLNPAMREQLGDMSRSAFENGYLWLAFLTVDNVKAAAALNFDYNNKLWGYNSGVNREYMDLSPGWVLLGHEIKWACEHGRDEFDFMRGAEDYKYRFGAVDSHVMRLIVAPS